MSNSGQVQKYNDYGSMLSNVNDIQLKKQFSVAQKQIEYDEDGHRIERSLL